MVEIRYVRSEDKEFWYSLDRHLPREEFANKIRDRRGYVLEEDGRPVGLLRYNLFWDNTPFCTMLFVDQERQGRGYGKKLMEHWETDMRSQGYGMALVSTQVDEEAQHFYRKLGYKDCGGFVVDIPGYEQPMEMFLVRSDEIRARKIGIRGGERKEKWHGDFMSEFRRGNDFRIFKSGSIFRAFFRRHSGNNEETCPG